MMALLTDEMGLRHHRLTVSQRWETSLAVNGEGGPACQIRTGQTTVDQDKEMCAMEAADMRLAKVQNK